MRYQPDIHHRRSIRLKAYDYSKPNAYFVTICAQNRELLFGEIQNGEMNLNQAGLMTFRWFQSLPNKFINLQCDEFICMPNHIHFIIRIEKSFEISTIIQWYKTMTTNEYIRGVKQNDWFPFNGKLWQRNYWEHIIRNENELNQIREYIQTNPTRWQVDKLFINTNIGKKTGSVGAHPRVRPVKNYEQPDNKYTNTNTNSDQISRLEKPGQTRGSAPTTSSQIKEITL